MKPKILIIEDEEAIRIGLGDTLTYHQYDVKLAKNGQEGWNLFENESFDLVLLDLMLPLLNGYEVCDRIQKQNKNVPIIMLTAKTSTEEIVQGLSMGADDYITKPFDIQEVLARISSLLRRTSFVRNQKKVSLGNIVIDPARLEIQNKTSTIEVTQKELDVILYLHQHMGRVISRQELLEKVWGYKSASNIDTRTVDIHIAKIRKKLSQLEANFVQTIRGRGYQFILE